MPRRGPPLSTRVFAREGIGRLLIGLPNNYDCARKTGLPRTWACQPMLLTTASHTPSTAAHLDAYVFVGACQSSMVSI
jgi:hypothetical protein